MRSYSPSYPCIKVEPTTDAEREWTTIFDTLALPLLAALGAAVLLLSVMPAVL